MREGYPSTVVDVSKLKELKALLDDGALTQAEFDEQKAKLLGNTENPSSESNEGESESAPRKKSKARSNKSNDGWAPQILGGLGLIFFALGLAVVGYRILAAMIGLYSATLMSICCMGCIEPNEISGGFGGAWDYVGVAFEIDDGDDMSKIIYFLSWEPVFYAGCGGLVLGLLMIVAGAMSEK